nr:MAG TPA: hypothetical protein [Caudoviricetes sp.]
MLLGGDHARGRFPLGANASSGSTSLLVAFCVREWAKHWAGRFSLGVRSRISGTDTDLHRSPRP